MIERDRARRAGRAGGRRRRRRSRTCAAASTATGTRELSPTPTTAASASASSRATPFTDVERDPRLPGRHRPGAARGRRHDHDADGPRRAARPDHVDGRDRPRHLPPEVQAAALPRRPLQPARRGRARPLRRLRARACAPPRRSPLRHHATALLDGHGQDRALVVLGDLNDEPLAATTQILLGPPGSEFDTGGSTSPTRATRQRLWNIAPHAPGGRALQPHLQRPPRADRPHPRQPQARPGRSTPPTPARPTCRRSPARRPRRPTAPTTRPSSRASIGLVEDVAEARAVAVAAQLEAERRAVRAVLGARGT